MALPVWQDLDKTHQVIIAAALGLALALVAVVRLQPSPSIWPLTPGLTNTLADRGGEPWKQQRQSPPSTRQNGASSNS